MNETERKVIEDNRIFYIAQVTDDSGTYFEVIGNLRFRVKTLQRAKGLMESMLNLIHRFVGER